MAEIVLKNAKIYMHGYDLSGNVNNLTLTESADIHDRTTFGSSARKRLAGLRNVDLSVSGFFDASSSKQIDPVAYPRIGTTEEVVSVMPDGSTEGSRAFFTKNVIAEYSPSGSIGEMFGFNLVGNGDYDLIRGKVLKKSTASTTGTGTAIDLGSRTTTQTLSAAIHCKSISSSGATLDVSVQSACSSGFGTVTTEIQFTQITDSSPIAELKASTQISSARQWCRTSITTTSTSVIQTGDFIISAGIR